MSGENEESLQSVVTQIVNMLQTDKNIPTSPNYAPLVVNENEGLSESKEKCQEDVKPPLEGTHTMKMADEELKLMSNQIENKKAFLLHSDTKAIILKNPENGTIVTVHPKDYGSFDAEELVPANYIQPNHYIRFKEPFVHGPFNEMIRTESDMVPNCDKDTKKFIKKNYLKVIGESFGEIAGFESRSVSFHAENANVNSLYLFQDGKINNSANLIASNYNNPSGLYEGIEKTKWNYNMSESYDAEKMNHVTHQQYINPSLPGDKWTPKDDERVTKNFRQENSIKLQENYLDKIYEVPDATDDEKYVDEAPQEFHWSNEKFAEKEQDKKFYLYPPKKRLYKEIAYKGRHLINDPDAQFSSNSHFDPDENSKTPSAVKFHPCSFCSRSFKSNSARIIHERIHTGEKPFSCQYCTKKFKSNYEKVIHERTHTGVKPYSCSMCDKNFTSLSYKKIHQRIHTGEKPYTCGKCHRAFKSLREVKVHEVIHGMTL